MEMRVLRSHFIVVGAKAPDPVVCIGGADAPPMFGRTIYRRPAIPPDPFSSLATA
jgi:hypothetical protein